MAFTPNLASEMSALVNIAILASGNGTNADRICRYFSDREDVNVGLIVTNKPHAGVLQIADRYDVPSIVVSNAQLEGRLMETLKSHNIDFVVLAGFLRSVPHDVVKQYDQRMVNIHPALLPKFGGKGMYGHHVHRAVIDSGERESGITIHQVSEHYDEGNIVFQARCAVDTSDTPDSLAEKIHQLEHKHYPVIIDQLIKDFNQ